MIRSNRNPQGRSEALVGEVPLRSAPTRGAASSGLGSEERSEAPRSIRSFAKRLLTQFGEDDAMTLAAAIAFYTALSLAPIVVIVLAVVGLIWGEQASSGQLVGQIDQMVGRQGAELTQQVIAYAAESRQTGWAAAIGVAMLVFAATGVFAQLQYALNRIWDVKAKPGMSVIIFIRRRLLSIGMILVIGFLLIVSLVASAAIHALTESVRINLPGEDLLWQGVSIGASLLIFTAVFAAMFKVLPDVEISWRTVWIGAAVTAVLFVIGKQLIGLYLGRGSVGSAYGAAGSLLVVLVWVYYSAIIFFFGAEFTQVYAASRGHRVEPSKFAVPERRCS